MNEVILHLSYVQHFSVGDGDGIRTTVFFRGCPLRCPWCHNPEARLTKPVIMHMKTGDELRGCDIAAADLMPELTEDADYYRESGGGVTLSGGEVLMQADGASELASMLKKEGISVYTDTSGAAPYSEMEKLIPFTDMFLYDIKTADAEKYRKIIGAELAAVRDNLARLVSDGANVRVRVPLIPGFNTSRADGEAIASLIADAGAEEVDLLPFHRFGSAKYEALGLEYAYRHTKPLTRDEINEAAEPYRARLITRIE